MKMNSISLQDLQTSPTARNRKERRKQKAIERAETHESKTDQRRAAFMALVSRALGHLWRGDEPDNELVVVLTRAWEPKRDEPFLEATTLLYKLAVGCVDASQADSPMRHRLGRMFDLLARVYCGEDHNVTSLRSDLILAYQYPEWRPPWIDGKAPRPSGQIKIPDGVPPWLAVLGAARGAFLQGMLPIPDMRPSLSQMTSGHPWAPFVSREELAKLHAAADVKQNKRKSNANDPRPKVPRGTPPWQMAGLRSLADVVLDLAREVDQRVPSLDLETDMSAAMKWLSGDEKNLTVDLPMLLAVSPVASTTPRKHGAGSQVVRGLRARGVEDPRILTTLANVPDTRISQEKKKPPPK